MNCILNFSMEENFYVLKALSKKTSYLLYIGFHFVCVIFILQSYINNYCHCHHLIYSYIFLCFSKKCPVFEVLSHVAICTLL